MEKLKPTAKTSVPAGTQKSSELFDTIAWLRVFLSMFVVAIHVNQYDEVMGAINAQTYESALALKTFFENGYRCFTACAVPAFFLISGMLFFRGNEFSFSIYTDKLKKRVKSLFVPFVIFHFFVINALADICQNRRSSGGETF